MSLARAWGVTLLLLVACGDPVRDDRIEALGPERTGVARGPLHRAGQPCLACHDGRAAGTREFSVAGTVFLAEGSERPAPGVRVELVDSAGTRFESATNCAGNFFVAPADFAPRYPLWVALQAGDYRIEMDSPVQRDGSCASCHAREPGKASAGGVYLFFEESEASKDGGACP